MKKTLIIAALLASLGSMQAQDTITTARLDGYFYNAQPDWSQSLRYSYVPLILDSCGVHATKFYVNKGDTLQVIGIAAAMASFLDIYRAPVPNYEYDDWWSRQYYTQTFDTTLEWCWEYLQLYSDDDSALTPTLTLLDQVMVHRLHDTAAYYINPDLQCGTITGRHPVFNVYEKYFDNPVTITDNFYVGVTTTTSAPFQGYTYKSLPLVMMKYFYEDPSVNMNEPHYIRFHCTEEDSILWYPRNFRYESYYIYPILQPADTTDPGTTDTTGSEIIDTTGTSPSDTLSIETVSRFTYLFPNPASHEVTITASFGITAVEAYNAAGTLVFSSRDNGSFKRLSDHALSLDLSSWPRGSYLLRIHTPAGTTTKKLIVQ